MSKGDLKKQTQFWTESNAIKVSYNKEIREKCRIGDLVKTKPILKKGKSDKAKGKRNSEFYALVTLCSYALFAKQSQIYGSEFVVHSSW